MKRDLLHKFLIFLFFISSNIMGEDFISKEYELVLKNYTKNSIYKNTSYVGIDYKNPNVKSLINKTLQEIQKFDVKALKTKEEELAFFINLYNVYVISIILENFPLNSIMDLGQTIFDKKIIKIHNQIYSLNDIEHNLIRKRFNEPRIHFALVCGAISCPDIRREMYVGKRLNEQLEDQTKTFLNSKKGVDIENNTLYISTIFDWYKEDFGTTDDHIVKFIHQYKKINLNYKKPIQFIPYLWDLNIIR